MVVKLKELYSKRGHKYLIRKQEIYELYSTHSPLPSNNLTNYPMIDYSHNLLFKLQHKHTTIQ